jgi:hypothetical protein
MFILMQIKFDIEINNDENKPYENKKRGEKKLIITSNEQEHKAQVA